MGPNTSRVGVKELDLRFWREWNGGKDSFIAEVDGMLAADVVFHGWFSSDYGLREFKENANELFNAFTDLQYTIDDILAEGDKVAVRYTMTGTFKDVFRGRSPTNGKVTLQGIDIHRFADGRIVECWSKADTMGWMRQLGPALSSKQ